MATPAPISHSAFCFGLDAGVLSSRPANTPEQAGSDRGQRAEQALRVPLAVPLHAGQIVHVDPSGEVRVFAQTSRRRSPAPARTSSAPNIRPAARTNATMSPRTRRFRNSSDANEVANRDALEHAQQPDVGPGIARAAIVDDPQHIQQERPPQHAPDARSLGPRRSTRRDSENTIDTPVTNTSSGKMKS